MYDDKILFNCLYIMSSKTSGDVMHLKLRLQLFLQLPLQVLLPLLLPFEELQKKSRTATSWKFYSVSDSSCRRVTFYSYKNLIYQILVLFQGQNEHTEDCSYCITVVDSILCLNISILSCFILDL